MKNQPKQASPRGKSPWRKWPPIAGFAVLIISNAALRLAAQLSGPWGQSYPANHPTPHGTELLVTFVLGKSTQYGTGWTELAITVALLVLVATLATTAWAIGKLLMLACKSLGRGTKRAAVGAKNVASSGISKITPTRKQPAQQPSQPPQVSAYAQPEL